MAIKTPPLFFLPRLIIASNAYGDLIGTTLSSLVGASVKNGKGTVGVIRLDANATSNFELEMFPAKNLVFAAEASVLKVSKRLCCVHVHHICGRTLLAGMRLLCSFVASPAVTAVIALHHVVPQHTARDR